MWFAVAFPRFFFSLRIGGSFRRVVDGNVASVITSWVVCASMGTESDAGLDRAGEFGAAVSAMRGRGIAGEYEFVCRVPSPRRGNSDSSS